MPLDRSPEFTNPPIYPVHTLVPEDESVIRDFDEPHGSSLTLINVNVDDNVETRTDNDKNSLIKRQAERFFDKVQSGIKPGRAANIMHTTLKKINNSEEMSAEVKRLMDTATLSAEVRKKLVRSSLNKLIVENVDSEDIKRQRLALDAIKQASSDPETGLENEQAMVEINVSELGTSLKGLKLPGIEPL